MFKLKQTLEKKAKLPEGDNVTDQDDDVVDLDIPDEPDSNK